MLYICHATNLLILKNIVSLKSWYLGDHLCIKSSITSLRLRIAYILYTKQSKQKKTKKLFRSISNVMEHVNILYISCKNRTIQCKQLISWVHPWYRVLHQFCGWCRTRHATRAGQSHPWLSETSWLPHRSSF